MKKPSQRKAFATHGWDLKMLEKENFILLYPDQNTGGIAQSLFKEYSMEPTVLLHTRNSAMSIRLAIQGLGAAFAPESYFREESRFFRKDAASPLARNRFLPQPL